MASDVGRALSEARSRAGIDLVEAERVTKIRRKYLRAMEQERWEELPGSAYVRGFLATYAKYLGLDPEEIVDRYRHAPHPDESTGPIPDEMLPKPGEIRSGGGRGRLALGLVSAVLALGIVLVAVSGGDDGGGEPSGSAPESGETAAEEGEPAAGETTTEEPEPERVKLRLRSTGTVWVCVTDNRDETLVNGETLSLDEERGPFEARAFAATFGNGSIEMQVDGEPVEVPERAEPQGYRINSNGVRELDSAELPLCQ